MRKRINLIDTIKAHNVFELNIVQHTGLISLAWSFKAGFTIIYYIIMNVYMQDDAHVDAGIEPI